MERKEKRSFRFKGFRLRQLYLKFFGTNGSADTVRHFLVELLHEIYEEGVSEALDKEY